MSASLKLLHNSKEQFITNLYQWNVVSSVASPKLWGTNVLSVSEEQYLIWDTESRSTKRQKMLVIAVDYCPFVPAGYAYACHQTQYVSCSKSETIVQCFMCNLISVSTCFMAETVRSKDRVNFLCEIFQFG